MPMRRYLVSFIVAGATATCGGTTNSETCEAGSCCANAAACDGGVDSGRKDSAPSDTGADSGPLVCMSMPMNVPSNSIATAYNGSLDCAGDEGAFPWKNGAPGTNCTGPLDCAATCCICSTGRAVLTSWCNKGKCADAAVTSCALAGTPTLSCGDLD
jgi:hypothetical protein